MKSRLPATVLGVLLTSAAMAQAAPPGIKPKEAAPPPAAPVRAPSISWNQWVSMFRDYMEMIAHFTQVSSDSSSSGVAAVIYTDEILRSKSPKDAIEYYTKLLPDVKDPVVQRAVRLRLAEHYRMSNQPEEALGQLRLLMTAPPPAAAVQAK